MAFDSHRGVMVLQVKDFIPAEAMETWEWDGANWTKRDLSGVSPPSNNNTFMAYDSVRDRIVLLAVQVDDEGGQPLSCAVWEYDGESWSEASVSDDCPLITTAGRMVFDQARQRVVLPGIAWPPEAGDADMPSTRDAALVTWEWDGQRWAPFRLSDRPPNTDKHAMAFDALRQVSVALCAEDHASQTWTWDGVGWTRRSPVEDSDGPMARSHAAMTFDEDRGRVVLFGGQSDVTRAGLNDTWEWDGFDWEEVTPSAGNPPPRLYPGLACDVARGRVVLFGGDSWETWEAYGDLWEWDGLTWHEIDVSQAAPPPRTAHAMAYDRARQRTVVFGGVDEDEVFGDTWEWDGVQWEEVALEGARPPARSSFDMVYDESCRCVRLRYSSP